MNNANTTRLFKEFGTKIGHHQYERYWDEIVQIILATEWWNSAKPLKGEQAAIWEGRAGFLDALFYTR
jgi:hypothetical protein